jgi:hypothetical protein
MPNLNQFAAISSDGREVVTLPARGLSTAESAVPLLTVLLVLWSLWDPFCDLIRVLYYQLRWKANL